MLAHLRGATGAGEPARLDFHAAHGALQSFAAVSHTYTCLDNGETLVPGPLTRQAWHIAKDTRQCTLIALSTAFAAAAKPHLVLTDAGLACLRADGLRRASELRYSLFQRFLPLCSSGSRGSAPLPTNDAFLASAIHDCTSPHHDHSYISMRYWGLDGDVWILATHPRPGGGWLVSRAIIGHATTDSPQAVLLAHQGHMRALVGLAAAALAALAALPTRFVPPIDPMQAALCATSIASAPLFPCELCGIRCSPPLPSQCLSGRSVSPAQEQSGELRRTAG